MKTQKQQLIYLAGQAPKEIPVWFEPEMPRKPNLMNRPSLVFGRTSEHKYKELYCKFYDGEDDVWFDDNNEVLEEFKKEVFEYVSKFKDFCRLTAEWERKRVLEVIFQWPIYWAKETLKRIEDYQ